MNCREVLTDSRALCHEWVAPKPNFQERDTQCEDIRPEVKLRARARLELFGCRIHRGLRRDVPGVRLVGDGRVERSPKVEKDGPILSVKAYIARLDVSMDNVELIP